MHRNRHTRLLASAAALSLLSAGVLAGQATAATTAPVVTTVDDTVLSGINAFQYTGLWNHHGGPDSALVGSEFSYSWTVGNSYTFRFTGSQGRFYGIAGPDEGGIRFLVDGRPIRTVDSYSAAVRTNVLLFDTGLLPNDQHQVQAVVSGWKNPASSANVVAVDYASVFVTAPPPPPPPPPPPTPLPGPVFNVSNFGAQGNGASDDTAALQAALNVAAGSGGSVYVPTGTYLISSALSYRGGFTLAGDGMAATTIANTTSRLGTTAMFRPTQDGLANVTVQGVTFDQRGDSYDRNGDSASEWLMDVRGTSNMTVQDCGFRHVRTIGIYSDTTAGATVVGLKVLRNHVFEADGDGFSWFGSFRDFVIDGNIVENTKDDAIAVQDKASGEYPTNIRISNNTIRNCVTRTNFGSTPNGIDAYGSDHVTIVGNTITNVLSNGILVGVGASRRGTYTWISNNVVSGAGAKNTTTDVPGNGVSLIQTDRVYLSGNTVTNSKDLDYNIMDSTDVQGN